MRELQARVVKAHERIGTTSAQRHYHYRGALRALKALVQMSIRVQFLCACTSEQVAIETLQGEAVQERRYARLHGIVPIQ